MLTFHKKKFELASLAPCCSAASRRRRLRRLRRRSFVLPTPLARVCPPAATRVRSAGGHTLGAGSRLSVGEYADAGSLRPAPSERRQTMTGLRPDGCVRRRPPGSRLRRAVPLRFAPLLSAASGGGGGAPPPPRAFASLRLGGGGPPPACSPPSPAAARGVPHTAAGAGVRPLPFASLGAFCRLRRQAGAPPPHPRR